MEHKSLSRDMGYYGAESDVKHDASVVLNKLSGNDHKPSGKLFERKGKFFYLNKDSARPTPRCGGGRSFSQIAPEEIDAGVLQVLKWLDDAGLGNISEEQLLRGVYGKFAAEDSGDRLVKGDHHWGQLEKSLERLKKEGRLRVGEEAGRTMVHLAESPPQPISGPKPIAKPTPAASATRRSQSQEERAHPTPEPAPVPAAQSAAPAPRSAPVESVSPLVAPASVKPAPAPAEPAHPAAHDAPAAAEPVLLTSNKQQFRPYGQVDMKATKHYSTEDFIYAVLKAEAPVHRDLVAKRLAAHKGHSKVDKYVKAESNTVLNKLPRFYENYYGAVFEQGKDEKFIYRIKGPARPKPRVGGDREFSWIAPEEIDAGVLKVLKWLHDAGHASIAKEQLLREVYAKFAAGGSGEKLIRDDYNWRLLEESLDRLKEEGRLRVGNYADRTVVYLQKGKG